MNQVFLYRLIMENKNKGGAKKMGYADFDTPCACGSGEIAGACCKSGELCPCGSGERAGLCCYAPQSGDEDEE